MYVIVDKVAPAIAGPPCVRVGIFGYVGLCVPLGVWRPWPGTGSRHLGDLEQKVEEGGKEEGVGRKEVGEGRRRQEEKE